MSASPDHDLTRLTPQVARLVERYVTPVQLAEDTATLTTLAAGGEDYRHAAHGYLVANLIELGEQHADCAAENCPTCRTLGRALAMAVADNDVRTGGHLAPGGRA